MVAIGLLALGHGRAHSAPEPQAITTAWQFDMEFDQLRMIEVKLPTTEGSSFFWYLPYTVTNNTGEDRLFIPEFTVLGSDGSLVTAGRKINPIVFDAIKARLENPLLESPLQVLGNVLQGEDNARDSVAIWPVEFSDIDTMRVFVTGLSGETAIVADPMTDEEVILRKTLMLGFETPGDLTHVLTKPITFAQRTWVMR
jgi:hypothetical protein